LQLFDKITVIIPTHERHQYLKRSLDYWSQSEFQILVVDSSGDKFQGQVPDNINYFHYPNKPFVEKLIDGLGKIDTEYTVLCADDDFITPTGLNACIEFLEDNKDYIVAHGQYIAIVPPGNNLEPDGHFCWRQKYLSASNEFEDAVDRLRYHFKNYSCPTFYGVHRTSIMLLIKQETEKHTNETRFAELLPSMLSVIYGKVKRLDSLYCARERTLKKGNMPSLISYMNNGTYDKKYERFKNCLAKHLSKEADINILEAGKVVDMSMDKYLSRMVKNKKKSLRSKLKKRMVQFSERSKVGGFLKDIYNFVISSQYRSPFYFTDWPYSKDSEAFNLIKTHVLKYNKFIYDENGKK